MSPKQVKITPSLAGDRHPVVDPAHRDHADRAAGPVHQLDVLGQQVVDRRTCRSSGCARRRPPSACSGGRARPAERISPASARPSSASRNSSTNLMRRASGRAGDRRPGVDQQLVAHGHRLDRARSRRCSRMPVVVGAEREVPVLVDRARRASAIATSPQVMQLPVGSQCAPGTGSTAWSESALTRSRSPSAPRAPARSRRPCPRAACGWPPPPARPPWRSRSRRGSGPSRRARRPRRPRRGGRC